MEHLVRIKKLDEELQVVWAEVYAPNLPDSQGDFMMPDEIRKIAHGFLAAGRVRQVDRQHNNKRTGSTVVESFIAREGDPDFILDAWVVGIHLNDEEWQAVKDGEINGLSFEGFVHARTATVEIEVPEGGVRGITKVANEKKPHDHEFLVKFDKDGEFKGGEALPGEGAANHRHKIISATLTEEGPNGEPAHRFSFMEALVADGESKS